MTDENENSSEFGRTAACLDWVIMGSGPWGDGAKLEADQRAGVSFEVLAVLQSLGDQERMAVCDEGMHENGSSLAHVDLLELAALDAVAQDQLDGGTDALLVRDDRRPALLHGDQHHVVDLGL